MNVWRDFRLANVSISNSSMEEVLMSNLLQKLISELAFYVTIADADIGSLNT